MGRAPWHKPSATHPSLMQGGLDAHGFPDARAMAEARGGAAQGDGHHEPGGDAAPPASSPRGTPSRAAWVA
jgi:hypothetical protein